MRSPKGRRSELVFCWPDGRPYMPSWVTKHFRRAVEAADLPRLTLHGLRHTWATLALEAGVPLKVVSDRLGHSGIGVTANIYTSHVEELDRDAAEAVAALIEKGGR